MDRTLFSVRRLYSLITLLLFALLHCSTAIDNTTITRTQYITGLHTITSSGKIFKLGFFNPGTSSNSYVGIWYTNDPTRVVWIANRDNPVTDSSGVARIADNGNLVILDGQGIVVWSTNVSNVPVFNNSSSVIAELLDSGNLVLWHQKTMLWQSFDFPTNSLLPEMKIGVNRKTGKNIQLTAWKNPSDPSTGVFSVGIDLIDMNITQMVIHNGSHITQMVIHNGSHRHWRSGPWNNNEFLGTSLPGLSITRDSQEDNVHVSLIKDNNSFLGRYVLDHSGVYYEETWFESTLSWETQSMSSTSGFCNEYNRCGHNRICTESGSGSNCTCVPGYKFLPVVEDSQPSGCVREKKFQCERNRNSSSNASTNTDNEAGDDKDADMFVPMDNMKLPDFPNRITGPKNGETCRQECLKNCSCVAYSYADGIGCMTWGGRLTDVRDGYSDGVKLNIRISHTHRATEATARWKRNLIIILVVIGTLTIMACSCFCWRWLAKQRGRDRESAEISIIMDNKESSDPGMLGDSMELKIFKFENVVAATNNFCEANKLGEGGFGPVYRGRFEDGQEIAVKRLSKCSLQGFEEFKNEVLVILKLQHRNLVRLLGCCMEGEERLLIYEYMPNKSLDAFIFDSKKQALLDWRKRFQIIEGICRGIIYLHRDSRLRVIHRDLKASNVLLDEDLNPKISDFGMARIFGGSEHQANTRRVVGTYGYMSPEYAMDGLFSEKSDVYSFGVLLLEIVSGKRNTSFYHHEMSSSLLGYAWKLWIDNQTQLLIDPTLLSQPNSESEILRCIHVGLLCVEGSAIDRPTMYTALSMLTSEISSLPTPKQPAFTDRRVVANSSPSQINACSLSKFTISDVEGR